MSDIRKHPPTACPECDGTGWKEGGEGNALGVKCKACRGHGVAAYQLPTADLKLPPQRKAAPSVSAAAWAVVRGWQDNMTVVEDYTPLIKSLHMALIAEGKP